MMIPAMAGLILSLSFCKKETTTETVYDSGKAISGLVKYPDYNNAMVIAKGAVVYLYSGTSATGTLVGTTFADASGKYTFSHLAAGSYFLTSKYNTENSNFKNINGINFVTNPGYGVSLADVDLTKDIDLVSYVSAPTSLNISLDSTQNGYRQVTWEIHSKMDFTFPDHVTGAELPGGFNVFKVDRFAFDAANPTSTKNHISGYVTLSSINTFEPVRDELAEGCVRKTLGVDTLNATTPIPETDTARFTSTSIERYGDGYLAHGTLTAFYKSDGNTPGYPIDSANGYTGPYNQMVTKNCDLYFVYQGHNLYPSGANYKRCFIFEGQFVIKPLTDYYISSSHFGTGDILVRTHVQFLGALNTDYPGF